MRLSGWWHEPVLGLALVEAPLPPTVASLGLPHSSLADADVRGLLRATERLGLTRLELGGNDIGPPGAEHLAACERLAGLRWLGLAGNGIGAAALFADDYTQWDLAMSFDLTGIANREDSLLPQITLDVVNLSDE